MDESSRKLEDPILSDKGRLEGSVEIESHQIDVADTDQLISLVVVELFLGQDFIDLGEVCEARRMLDEGLQLCWYMFGAHFFKERDGVMIFGSELFDFFRVENLLGSLMVKTNM